MVTKESHGKLACLNWETLSDDRARNVRPNREIRRAAFIVTGACNFACPYCKTLGGDRAPTMKQDKASALLADLICHGLKELRLSGGEPTLVPWLPLLVAQAKSAGVRIAVSTNGYSSPETYAALVQAGVSEFSISLDSVDPEEADFLSGGRSNVLASVERTIRQVIGLGSSVYVGMTCSASRRGLKATVDKAVDLMVTDIKIMSPAQEGSLVDTSWLDSVTAARFPFLAWRAGNFRQGRNVRGLDHRDSPKCSLVLDDVTIAGDFHYPCNVYFREGGLPIGKVGSSESMLAERALWCQGHDSLRDPICSTMCMDLLRVYNNRVMELAGLGA